MSINIEDDGFWNQNADHVPDPQENDVMSPHESYTGGKSVFREITETIVLTLLIFFAVRAVVQNFKVEGDSMLPTLHSDQYLLVNKALYYRYTSTSSPEFWTRTLPLICTTCFTALSAAISLSLKPLTSLKTSSSVSLPSRVRL